MDLIMFIYIFIENNEIKLLMNIFVFLEVDNFKKVIF